MKRVEFAKLIVGMANLKTVGGFPARITEIDDSGNLIGRVGEPSMLSLRCIWDSDGRELNENEWLNLKLDSAVKKILADL